MTPNNPSPDLHTQTSPSTTNLSSTPANTTQEPHDTPHHVQHKHPIHLLPSNRPFPVIMSIRMHATTTPVNAHPPTSPKPPLISPNWHRISHNYTSNSYCLPTTPMISGAVPLICTPQHTFFGCYPAMSTPSIHLRTSSNGKPQDRHSMNTLSE